MLEWISGNTTWFWLIAGTVLLIGEILLPGVYLLWIGAAAFVTALVVWLVPDMMLLVQTIIFSFVAIASIVATRRYLKNNPMVEERPNLGKRGMQQIGKVYTLADAIVDGTGRVKIGDSLWTVSGPDLPEGDRVRIVSVEGAALTVEAAPAA